MSCTDAVRGVQLRGGGVEMLRSGAVRATECLEGPTLADTVSPSKEVAPKDGRDTKQPARTDRPSDVNVIWLGSEESGGR